MKAILLSAGKGSRLGELTTDRPKCLIPIGSQTLIDWQLDALRDAGVDEVIVVVGFQSAMMERHLARRSTPGLRVRTVLNPFYQVADNLGSCWVARHEMTGEFLVVNGDTLFEPDIAMRLLTCPDAPVTITIDRKNSYDDDDMLVACADGLLRAVGKQLPPEVVTGESIGMLRFRGEGPALFTEVVDAMMRTPQGTSVWYLQAIDRLARRGVVGTCLIEGLDWAEVDFVADLERARVLVSGWEQVTAAVG